MSDDIKKTDNNVDAEEKSVTDKKSTTASKKAKEESIDASDKEGNKKKIVEKLQAMGLMSGGEREIVDNAKSSSSPAKVLIASVVGVLITGSFVWALNKERINETNVSSTPIHSTPLTHSGSYTPNNHNRMNNNYSQQQNHFQQQQEQHKKWMQQQQEQHIITMITAK